MNVKDLFKKRKFVFLTLFLIIFFQFIYSFFFPTCGYTGTGHGWLSLQDLINHKRSSLEGADTLFIKKITPLFSNYRVNADGAEYIVLAKNFPKYYFDNPIYLSRPLYSFLIAVVAFLPHFIYNSYATYFASAIFLNLILALATMILFYVLIERIISSRVAFLSSFLFIFSPFMHAGLIQPIPEIYGAFMIVVSIYLLYDYVKKTIAFEVSHFFFNYRFIFVGQTAIRYANFYFNVSHLFQTL